MLGTPAGALHQPPTSPAPLDATVSQAHEGVESARAYLVAGLEQVAEAAQVIARNLADFQSVDNATIERVGTTLVLGAIEQGQGGVGRLATVGGLWTAFGVGAVGAIRDYAATEVAAWASQSAPNQRIVSIWPVDAPVPPVDSDDPPTLTQGPAPVAYIQGGRYAFQAQLLDRDGDAVPWSSFDLDVFGLEALPAHGHAEAPATASYAPPARVATLLYSTHVGSPSSATNGTRLDAAACAGQTGCAFLQLPASALRTERLYSGASVLLRVRLPENTVGWHSALANLATQAASTAEATPFLTQDETRRLREVADQLDQFPTPVLLAGPKDAASQDPDLDSWPTAAELAWNSDPLDYLSRPGSDDDADGHANFAEASRARAAGWPDDLQESSALQDAGPVPFAGRTILVNEEAPPASDVPTSDPERLRALPVLEAAVAAGPGAFMLQGLTLHNVAPRPLEAGTSTGLQRLTVLRTDGSSPTLVASWSFQDASWRLDPGSPTGVRLDCGACGASTTDWSLSGLEEAGDRTIPLLVVAEVSPEGPTADTYDGSAFMAELEPAETFVILDPAGQGPDAVGPPQRAPLQRVDVGTERLVFTSPAMPDRVAGKPFTVDVCARDHLGNLDRDFGADASGFLLVSYSQGASAAPSGDLAKPDLRSPAMHRAQEGCARVGADLVFETPRDGGLTLFRAGEDTRLLVVDAATGLRTESGPLTVGPSEPARLALSAPSPPVGAKPLAVSADAGHLALTFTVTDRYGNPSAAGLPVQLQHGALSSALLTNEQGEVEARIETGRVAGTSHRIVATCLDLPAVHQEIVVVAGAPARIQVLPDAVEVPIRGRIALFAHGWDAYGNALGIVRADWSLVDGPGELDSVRGEYRAPDTNSTAIVRAQVGDLSSDLTILVVPNASGGGHALDSGAGLPSVPEPLLLVLALAGAGAALAAKKARVLVVTVDSTKVERKLFKVRTKDEIPRIGARLPKTPR